MVIGPGKVPYSIIHSAVRVSGSFCAKFPDCPLFTMFLVEVFCQVGEGGSVGRFGVCA